MRTAKKSLPESNKKPQHAEAKKNGKDVTPCQKCEVATIYYLLFIVCFQIRKAKYRDYTKPL